MELQENGADVKILWHEGKRVVVPGHEAFATGRQLQADGSAVDAYGALQDPISSDSKNQEANDGIKRRKKPRKRKTVRRAKAA